MELRSLWQGSLPVARALWRTYYSTSRHWTPVMGCMAQLHLAWIRAADADQQQGSSSSKTSQDNTYAIDASMARCIAAWVWRPSGAWRHDPLRLKVGWQHLRTKSVPILTVMHTKESLRIQFTKAALNQAFIACSSMTSVSWDCMQIAVKLPIFESWQRRQNIHYAWHAGVVGIDCRDNVCMK